MWAEGQGGTSFSHFTHLSAPCSAGLGLGSGSFERSLSLGLSIPTPPTEKPAWTGMGPWSPSNAHQEWRAGGLLACEMSPPAIPASLMARLFSCSPDTRIPRQISPPPASPPTSVKGEPSPVLAECHLASSTQSAQCWRALLSNWKVDSTTRLMSLLVCTPPLLYCIYSWRFIFK